MSRHGLGAMLALATLFCSLVAAQGDSTVVWAAAVFVRSGEHTTDTNTLAPLQLTPFGANQSYNAGAYLRDAYLGRKIIPGIDPSVLNPNNVYVLADDQGQFGPASAQALLQGLYPPVELGNGAAALDPEAVMADGSVVEPPLNGYQYAWIRSAGSSNPDSIYVNGAQFCTTWNTYSTEYYDSVLHSQTEASTLSMYAEVGKLLANETFDSPLYGYWNAYDVYEQVSYAKNHYANASQALSSGALRQLDAYNRIRYLADQYVWGLYGDTRTSLDPISTIAGQAMAEKIKESLGLNVGSMGQQNKLSILVGDYTPLVSFFGLAGLEDYSSDFTGLPEWGSMATFELFAAADAPLFPDDDGNQYPYEDELRVRFTFRNGTNAPAVAVPLFGRSETSMSYLDFQELMDDIAIGELKEWCGACDAWLSSQFCLFYNETAKYSVNGLGNPPNYTLPGLGISMTPVVAGLIGACVTFAVLGLLIVLAVVLCGLRFSFASRRPRDSAGGFKGDQKMASDADLTAHRGPPGINVEDHGATKERIGSWELKQQQAARSGAAGEGSNTLRPGARTQTDRPVSAVSSIRRSFDTQDPVHNPFQDPVKPDERV